MVIMRYWVIMAKKMLDRKIRSWACANIILDNGLFDEWKVFCYAHPKIKSKYRSGNLFLLHKKLRYKVVANPVNVNMDSLEDYYWDNYFEPNDYDGSDIGSATVSEMKIQNGEF